MSDKVQRALSEVRAVADLISSARPDELGDDTLAWAGVLMVDLIDEIERASTKAED